MLCKAGNVTGQHINFSSKLKIFLFSVASHNCVYYTVTSRRGAAFDSETSRVRIIVELAAAKERSTSGSPASQWGGRR